MKFLSHTPDILGSIDAMYSVEDSKLDIVYKNVMEEYLFSPQN